MEIEFTREVEQLKLGAGAMFEGEGILAITKALLQSGVAYVGGYQGAPVSHLLDVMVQAKPYLAELGVHVEPCANELVENRGLPRGGPERCEDLRPAHRQWPPPYRMHALFTSVSEMSLHWPSFETPHTLDEIWAPRAVQSVPPPTNARRSPAAQRSEWKSAAVPPLYRSQALFMSRSETS